MKEIALINDFPEGTGIGNYAFGIFEQLRKKGVEMVYLGRKGKNSIDYGINLPVMKKSLNNLYYFPKKIPEGFKLYHASNQLLSKISLYRKPCIVSVMDVIPKTDSKEYNSIMSFLWRQSMKYLPKAEKILAISGYTKKQVEKHYGVLEKKIDVTYLACSKEFKERSMKKSKKVFGFGEEKLLLNVGSEEERKDIDSLLNSFAKVLEDFPDAKLVRVGRPLEKNLNRIRKLGLEDRVKYFHGISEKKLALLYNSADVFVFPSYNEGFGLPLLEAMNSGVPVIACNATSVPEVVGSAGILVKPKDVNGYAKAVEEVLESKRIWNEMKKKGLRQAKKFSWKKCAAQTLKAYEEVLK